MNTVNAIAKVRFATAKPQRLLLSKSDGLVVELLCLETGQRLTVHSGEWSYYVVTGTASLTWDDESKKLATGHLAVAAPGEKHIVSNAEEGRLVLLATGKID